MKQQHQKFLLLGICFATFAATTNNAFAESDANITLYGTVDYGYAIRFNKNKKIDDSNEFSKTNSRLNGGQSDSNKIGIRGSENFGNGNKAVFVLEREFLLDTGSEDGWTQTFVGIENEKLGSVFGGYMDSLHYSLISELDPFKAGTVGNYANVRGDIYDGIFHISSVKNSLIYISPNVANFTFSAMYSNNMDDEDSPTKNNTNDNFYNLAVNYEGEKFTFGASYHYINFGNKQNKFLENSNTKNLHNFTLGGAYEFDNELKISAFVAYDKLNFKKNSPQISNSKNIALTHIMLGAEKPFGRHNIKGSLNYSHNKKSQFGKAWQIAVGYDYNFSKRTNFYAAYSYIKNNNARAVATHDFQNEGGIYQQGLQFGIKHNF